MADVISFLFMHVLHTFSLNHQADKSQDALSRKASGTSKKLVCN